MNDFLKVLLLLLVVIVAVKLLPAIFALGFVLGLAVVVMGAVGVSILATTSFASAILLAVLSPIWVPVLVVVGLIGLIKRNGRRTA
jgi:hypothetical protein